MKSKLQIFHYENTGSILHRSDPRVKILGCICFAVATFFIDDAVKFCFLLALFVLCCAMSKINIFRLARSIWFVLLGLLIITSLNLFVEQGGNIIFALGCINITDFGLHKTLIYGGRLVLLFMAGSLLMAITSPIEITEAIASLLSPLKKLGLPIDQLSFVLALAIRYVPILADEFQKVRIAQSCRGAKLNSGGLKGRTRAFSSLIVPVMVSSIRHAENLSLALLSKNYTPGAPRTKWTYNGYLKRLKQNCTKENSRTKNACNNQ